MKRSTLFSNINPLSRVLTLILAISVFLSLCVPIFQDAAAQVGSKFSGPQTAPGQARLGKHLPELSGVRQLKMAEPVAPPPFSNSQPCFDCRETAQAGEAFAAARLDPHNRTGQKGFDLLSQNFNWSKTLINLPGRARLNLNLNLVYNSLVWTRADSRIAFDVDRGQPAPGFRLGFPTIQQRFRDPQTGRSAYLLLTSEGSPVLLGQVGESNIYEAADNSLLQLIDRGKSGALLRRPDGLQFRMQWVGGQLQCTEIKDRNGNYINVGYDNRGHLSNITDTVGRLLTFNRDRGGNLLSITQGRGAAGRTLATFGYSDLTMQTNFNGLQLIGPANNSSITVLRQVGLPDGSRYTFDYNSWGQVQRISLVAADGHTLAYTSYNLPSDGSLALTDCPRPTEMRAWAEDANNDAEALTRFELDANGEWGQAILPDGSTRKEFFGTAGWQRGLSLRVEQRAANGALQKANSTEWTQQPIDNSDLYRIVPRSQDSLIMSATGGQQRTRTEYNGYGLPQDVYDYKGDGAALSQRTHLEYNLDKLYLERHIIGLLREQTTYDGSGALLSKTTHTYDLPDSIVDQGAALQHDDAAYGASLLSGRGLLSAISHWDARHPDKAGQTRIGYNTTGSIAFMRNSDGQQTNVSYEDNFSDQKGRGTLAFATTAVHADGSRTLTQYDYETGKVVRNQSAKGEVHSFTYDAGGRLTMRKDEKTGGMTRRVYLENGTLVATFQKVNAHTKEFGRYSVYDGARRLRAIALDPLSSVQGYRGVYINRDVMGRPVNHSKPTRINSSWAIAETQVSLNTYESKEQAGDAALMASSLKRFGERLLSGLNELANAVEPTASAQDCGYDPYYGDSCEDPYGNDWFYGDEWGYDYYWDWTEFADALVWGDDQYWYTDDWDTLSYLAQLSDAEFEAQYQLWNAGLLGYASELTWNGHGYTGYFPTWIYDSLMGDSDFANGILYGFHVDVGRNAHDFRSYTGTFGDGSLQIVMDRYTGHFYADVDRFNPYQDVVNAFGHVFGEVLPHLFRRIF
ncbi:MAG TPA: hypothetical protein VGB17_11360 [Pyrinomonadaceae bacterium]|jgi:YD repeat-containing protein